MTTFDADKGLCPGDVILVWGAGGGGKYYKIVGRDKLLFLDTGLGSVAAGATSALTQINDLNPPDDLVYQINRIEIVQGNVKNQVRHPQTTSRFGTERSPAGGLITDTDDHVTVDLWIFENFPPALAITNDTTVAIAEVVRWIGWTYRIQEIGRELPGGKKLSPCHEVTVGGICR